jgi:hydrogenase nickel insertion protein HypA
VPSDDENRVDYSIWGGRLVKQDQVGLRLNRYARQGMYNSSNPKLMNELHFTKAVFDRALQQIPKSNAARIKSVHLVLGEVSELDQDIIRNYWHELSMGTPLERARLHFRLITAEVQCMACFKKYHPVNGAIHCPHCGSFGAKILSGEGFHVEHIEMDNE